MDIELKYYKLSDDKRMGDGKLIPQSQELILIREEDDMFFLETHGEGLKSIFWAKEGEVEFIKVSTENWDDDKIIERNRYINGDFI